MPSDKIPELNKYRPEEDPEFDPKKGGGHLIPKDTKNTEFVVAKKRTSGVQDEYKVVGTINRPEADLSEHDKEDK